MDEDFRKTHKDLYGALLAANERIDDAGSASFWVLIVVALLLCVGLHMEWIDDLVGVEFGRMRGWGVYALIVVACFAIFMFLASYGEQRRYSAAREELAQLIVKHGLDKNTLIGEIAGDEKLEKISEHLRKDDQL